MKLSSNATVRLIEEAAIFGGATVLTFLGSHLAGLNLGGLDTVVATGLGLAASYLYKVLSDNGVNTPT
jgi:hypothetical protein